MPGVSPVPDQLTHLFGFHHLVLPMLALDPGGFAIPLRDDIHAAVQV